MLVEERVNASEIGADAYFAIVPEWVLDSHVSDRSVRVYARLGRYADRDRVAFPSRPTLATACRCSVDSIDRALKELIEAGALSVEKRFRDAGDQTSNRYTLHRNQPKEGAATRAAGLRP